MRRLAQALEIYLGRKTRKRKLHSSQPSVPSTSIEIHTSDEDSLFDEPEDANAKKTDDHSSSEDNLMAAGENL